MYDRSKPTIERHSRRKNRAKLDAADGKKDGKINASIWNEFVADKGGKTIKESIDVVAAMNSITTYAVKNAATAGKAVNDLAKEWLGAEAPAPAEGNETPAPAQTNPDEQTPPTVDEAQTAKDAESVKVTVPKAAKPTNKAEVDSIIKNQKAGREVADKIKNAFNAFAQARTSENLNQLENALKLINKDNVIYVVEYFPDVIDKIHEFRYKQDDVIKYILTPLGEKGDEANFGIGEGEQKMTRSQFYEKSAKRWSFNAMKSEIKSLSKDIASKERQVRDDYTTNLKAYNNAPKVQKTFDDANKLLAEVANMNPKPEITKGEGWANAKLPDGRWIEVKYGSNGEIEKILVSHDTTPNVKPDGSSFDGAEISYSKNEASYDINKNNFGYEGSITRGYDFEKLKALAQKIFG